MQRRILCVFIKTTQTQAKLRFWSALCKGPMGILANKCNFFRDSLAEFSNMQRPDSP